MKIRIDRNAESFGFGITRLWGGKLVYLHLWRFSVVLDLRKDWAADMRGRNNPQTYAQSRHS